MGIIRSRKELLVCSSNMKAFIAVLVAFAAVAVNATEDDPYHYTLIKKEGPGWDLKALPAPAHPHPYYWGWYGRKKRSAEADPQLLYHHGLPHVLPAAHVLPVAHPVARTAAVTAVEHTPAEVTHTVTPVVAHYAHPYGYGLWGRKKREAEPDTVNGVPLAYGHGLLPHVAPLAVPVARTAAVTGVEHHAGAVTHTVTPVVAPVYAHYGHPYGYGLWGRKKREAEADAEASPYYYGYYGAGYPYYGYGYAHHGYYGIHPSHYGICHNNLGARVPC